MAKSKVNIQPLADRVVVKAAEAETKTKSILSLSGDKNERDSAGYIIF